MTDEEASVLHQWNRNDYPKSDSNTYNYFRKMYDAVIDGEWIIYSNELDNYNLYKRKLDGSHNVELINSSAVDIKVSGNWIYFSNYSYGGYLFKIRKDGLGLTQLNNEYSTNIRIEGIFRFHSDFRNMINQ